MWALRWWRTGRASRIVRWPCHITRARRLNESRSDHDDRTLCTVPTHRLQTLGLAILAWENDSKRAYQFQDGKLRVFKRGYYHFFEEVDRPLDRVANIMSTLERGLDVFNARLEARRAKRDVERHSATGTTLARQVWLFGRSYESGFTGDTWKNKHRGAGAKRRLKRHRDRAIAHAQTALSAGDLDELIEAGQYRDIVTRVVDVLSATDLVAKAQVKPIEGAADDLARGFATAVRELLYGEDSYSVRFEKYVAALARAIGKEPSWQLATALPALVHPDQHVCIRPTVFKAQAAWMAPRLAYVKRPNAPLYQRYLQMTQTVGDELRKVGHAPRDLLDVYDFMLITLRPSAFAQYESMVSQVVALQAPDARRPGTKLPGPRDSTILCFVEEWTNQPESTDDRVRSIARCGPAGCRSMQRRFCGIGRRARGAHRGELLGR